MCRSSVRSCARRGKSPSTRGASPARTTRCGSPRWHGQRNGVHRLPGGNADARPRPVADGETGPCDSRFSRTPPIPGPLGHRTAPSAVRADQRPLPRKTLPSGSVRQSTCRRSRAAVRRRGPRRGNRDRHGRDVRPGRRAAWRKAPAVRWDPADHNQNETDGVARPASVTGRMDAWLTTARVAVLGAGSWGTTFAKILADGGADVALWARRPELAREISQSKRNCDSSPASTCPATSGRARNCPRCSMA